MGYEAPATADGLKDGDTVRWVKDDCWKGYLGVVTNQSWQGVYVRLRTTKMDRYVSREDVPKILKVFK